MKNSQVPLEDASLTSFSNQPSFTIIAGTKGMSDSASSSEGSVRVPRTGDYMFVMGRERGQG